MPTYFRAQRTLQNTLGQALAGALLYVVNQPVSSGAGVIPPAPLATLFADTTGTPLSNPVIVDGQGNAFYYTQGAVIVTEVYVYSGVIVKSLPDQNNAVSAVSNILIQANGVTVTDQAKLNIYSSTGTVIITPDAIGNIDLQAPLTNVVLKTNGTLNSDQGDLNIASADGSVQLSNTSGTTNISVTPGARPSTARWNYANFNNPSTIAGGGNFCIGLEPSSNLTGGGSTSTIVNATGITGARWHLSAPDGSTYYDNFNTWTASGLANVTLGTLRFWELSLGVSGTTPGVTDGPWYYLGLGINQPNGGGYTSNSIVISGDFVGFRFNPVTYGDQHWQAICIVGGSTITVANTGITPDATTAPHVFAFSSDGSTTLTFYIDGVQVATLPISATSGAATSGYFGVSVVSLENSTVAMTTDQYLSYHYYETI